jgi:hypothetical protein
MRALGPANFRHAPMMPRSDVRPSANAYVGRSPAGEWRPGLGAALRSARAYTVDHTTTTVAIGHLSMCREEVHAQWKIKANANGYHP